jgi:Phytanoyl-CoA dioxygenase (PhyH)
MSASPIKSLRAQVRLLARHSDFAWRYVLHARPAVQYAISRERPNGLAARLASDLQRDGVVITSASEFLGGSSCLGELETAVRELEERRAGDIAHARAEIDRPGPKTQKPFVLPLLSADEGIDPSRVFTCFALQDPIRQVVNRYFGMYAKLTHTNVWHTVVTSQPPSQSQLWHRDPEDRHILKMFLYLSDVDEGAGPFTYAVGSHKDPYRIAPHKYLDGETPRSTDSEMAKLVPPQGWVSVTAPKGTLVFADTRGYHKGGLARRSERIAFVAEYLAGAAHGISTSRFPAVRSVPGTNTSAAGSAA